LEDLNNIAEEIFDSCIENIENENIEDEVVIGLYYISKYIEEGHTLSVNSHNQLNKIILLLNKKSHENLKLINNIRTFILKYILDIIENKKSLNKIKEEFFKTYYDFNDFQNIIDNKDFILLIFPQEKMSEYLECLNAEFKKDREFWDKTFIEKQQVIFKFHYLTVLIFERSKEPFLLMFEYLFKIFKAAIENKDNELIFYLYWPLFFSYNGVATSYDENFYFNKVVEEKFETYIKDSFAKEYNLKPNLKKITNKKLKVAFVLDRLIDYSVYQVTYRLLKKLVTKVDLIVIDLNFKELGGSLLNKQQELTKIGCPVIDCHKEFVNNDSVFYSTIQKSLKVREFIISQDIDVLIGMNNRPEYTFLFGTRTAPLQVYWSHGNHAYNISDMDKKITHCIFDKGLDFEQIIIPFDNNLIPTIDDKKINEIKECFPKNCLILGSIGRLIKIDNYDYLETIAKIMHNNPNTVFLACGSGDQSSIQEKIEGLGIKDRFYFVGYVDPHIYGSVIDLYLDSFPFRGGESFQEYIAKQKPFVCYVPHSTKEQLDSIVNESRKYFYPNTLEKYVEYVSLLIKDIKLRESAILSFYSKEKEDESNFLNIIKKGTNGI